MVYLFSLCLGCGDATGDEYMVASQDTPATPVIGFNLHLFLFFLIVTSTFYATYIHFMVKIKYFDHVSE